MWEKLTHNDEKETNEIKVNLRKNTRLYQLTKKNLTITYQKKCNRSPSQGAKNKPQQNKRNEGNAFDSANNCNSPRIQRAIKESVQN